ncbi:Tryptophan--tRNA ligase [Anoxybacillus thermarum]|uniref:Tryptophan--tRNA ligase n=1 Tax=Anoxybacillus thermarum TaxID=404937 RepID=A0A0D0RUM6_9BACL|nr:tryptophan--tRNA ligase [Anoxybacillus thermarum]KIQ93140.1 Tryptophan--tRNA ligase [Anoxybacillus thermarum]
MDNKIVLTGIKPTGRPHLGNYIGAIKPALNLAKELESLSIFFIADYHALTSIKNPELFKEYTYDVAATWLAMGLDPNKVIFYKQSDIPQIFELSWILSCFTPKGLMNRAHAYKAKVDENKAKNIDIDMGVNMGLFTYPILMAADILLFNSNIVPVGKDQVQHVEIARDIANAFNNCYGEIFTEPSYLIRQETAVIPGLDGRKMSKSYNNTIPLFCEPKELKNLINKIKTDSSLPNEPKNIDSPLFLLYKEFATDEQIEEMKEKFINGIPWGEVKKELFEVINSFLETPRKKYNYLMNNRHLIDEILEEGAKKAQEICIPNLNKIKEKIGCQ